MNLSQTFFVLSEKYWKFLGFVFLSKPVLTKICDDGMKKNMVADLFAFTIFAFAYYRLFRNETDS